MTLPNQRRRQILDEETAEALRFHPRLSQNLSGPRSSWMPGDIRVQGDTLHQDDLHQDDLHQDALGQDAPGQDTLSQDAWVTSFMGRLAALVRHVGGSGK